MSTYLHAQGHGARWADCVGALVLICRDKLMLQVGEEGHTYLLSSLLQQNSTYIYTIVAQSTTGTGTLI